MDFTFASAISASGMEAERTRLDVASINLANVHTSRTAGGGPFKPLRVAMYQPAFSPSLVEMGTATYNAPNLLIQQADVAPRLVYEPGHPDANDKGFVAYPGIDTVSEMINLMTAVRAYEANVVAINAAKSMAMKALDIGSGT